MIPRRKRWGSPEWRAFVRSLPCSCRDPRCHNCSFTAYPTTPVIAAHLRNFAGMGQKPCDFLVYPLSDQIHKVFHSNGQQSVSWQLERVIATLRAGFERGVLQVFPNDMEAA